MKRDTICVVSKTCKAIANSPVSQVFAGPLFLKVKIKFHFTECVINKSTRVIIGLVQLVIL